MRHYEIVFLVHPDQGDQVTSMIDRYRTIIKSHNGAIHRLENWGRRQLAFPVQKAHKAHYILMNIECDQQTIKELESAFRFSDAVLRNLIIRRDKAITNSSPFAKKGPNKTSKPPKPKEAQEAVAQESEAVTEKVINEEE